MNATHRIPSFAITAALACTSSLLAQASWQIAYPAQSPLPDYQWSAAFDEARGEGLIRKGNVGWRWNGSTWTQMTGPGPNLGTGSVMVYDVMRQCVVLWGNVAGFPPGNTQLWEWNGATWQQRLVAMPPFPGSVGYAYDRARGVTVVFGGTTTNDDTWEWNGVAWTHPLPAVRPPAREQSAMAFDPITQRCLLYGGFGANQVKLVDTWTWNGSSWQQQFPASPPFSRDQATMVVDVDRARVVLQGGSLYDFQTWEWDGAQWHHSNPNSPGAWQWMTGFYDTVRRETVLHGGTHPYVGNTNYTWRYSTPSAATAIAFGAGCAGSAGTPVLAKAPYTLPWLGDTMRTRVTTVPAGLGALFVSSFTPATKLTGGDRNPKVSE